MRSALRTASVGILLIGGMLTVTPPGARAQMAGPSGSLGGYGAGTITSYYSGGGGGYVPYGGGMGGFIPYSGGAGGLGVVPRVSRQMDETAIGGSSMMMYGLSSGPRMGARSSPPPVARFGYRGAMASRGSMGSMSSRGGSRPMSSGMGYPFRQPPSLTGSSMSMP